MSASATTKSARSTRPANGPGGFLLRTFGHDTAVLAVITGCYLMIALDATVVNVALPAIRLDLGFSATGLAWVFNAYLLTFGGLLLLGGRIGDIFGRRRTFVAGVLLFTVSSLLAGMAASAPWLVAARGLQGVGGALTTPNALALLATSFAEGAPRNRALSVYTAVAMSGASIGLIVGGILTTYASWRWALLMNVPIGAAVAYAAPRLLADIGRRSGHIDVAGALTSTLGMAGVVFGLIRAGADGWDAETFAALGGGLALLVAFIVVELNASEPVVPIHLLRDRRRLGAYVNLLLLPTGIFGTFFFVTQFLQEVIGFDPLAAGLAFLPQTVATIVAVRRAPALIARFGAATVMIAGAVCVAAGVAWMTRIGPDSSYLVSIFVPLVLIGTGAGWSFMPLNATILGGVERSEAGAASAVAQSMQWVGGSLGLAVLVTVFGSASAASPAVAAGAGSAASAAAAAALAFTHGASAALSVGVGFVLATLVVALVVIRPGSRRAVQPGSDRGRLAITATE